MDLVRTTYGSYIAKALKDAGFRPVRTAAITSSAGPPMIRTSLRSADLDLDTPCLQFPGLVRDEYERRTGEAMPDLL